MTAPLDDELCELFGGRLKIFQKREGYRFSVDSIVLGYFARAHAAGRVADLGTGSGVLPLILSNSEEVQEIIGVEVQEDLAALAQKNISYNNCGNKVKIISADIRALKEQYNAGSFDTVISNPPFYPAKAGRINPDNQKAISRHELHGSLADFLGISSYLLKLSGRFITIYASSRLIDLVDEMRKVTIEPKTLQFIHPKKAQPANLVLVQGIKGAGKEAHILPPLVLYTAAGEYTAEAQEIFNNL
jgi:tRNA1Val (adenine37-N6)-methyltransferase